MLKYKTTYQIRYQYADDKFPRVLNASYKYLESAMKKAHALKADKRITKITLRDYGRGRKIYSYDHGFETYRIYNN